MTCCCTEVRATVVATLLNQRGPIPSWKVIEAEDGALYTVCERKFAFGAMSNYLIGISYQFHTALLSVSNTFAAFEFRLLPSGIDSLLFDLSSDVWQIFRKSILRYLAKGGMFLSDVPSGCFEGEMSSASSSRLSPSSSILIRFWP